MLPNHKIKIKSEKLYSAIEKREELTDSQKLCSKSEVEWKSLRMQ